jgi:ferredoxin
MPIIVNKEVCIGCGACASLCPDTFELNADGRSEPINQDNKSCALNAAESCPVQAITVE